VYDITAFHAECQRATVQSDQKRSSLPCSTFSTLLPDDCCVLLVSGACFLSAEIFGEQFLRVGRVAINGCTCNNFSDEIKRLVSVVVVVVVDDDYDDDDIVIVVVVIVIVITTALFFFFFFFFFFIVIVIVVAAAAVVVVVVVVVVIIIIIIIIMTKNE
jgi:hypothetical protein